VEVEAGGGELDGDGAVEVAFGAFVGAAVSAGVRWCSPYKVRGLASASGTSSFSGARI
jgi:hypothetical protein